MKYYRPQEWDANDFNITLSVLSKVPFRHVFTAIGEWIEQFRWTPKACEWKEIASRHWEDFERRERLKNPRLTQAAERPLSSEEFRGYLKAEAEKGDASGEWARTVLARLEGKLLKVPPA